MESNPTPHQQAPHYHRKPKLTHLLEKAPKPIVDVEALARDIEKATRDDLSKTAERWNPLDPNYHTRPTVRLFRKNPKE